MTEAHPEDEQSLYELFEAPEVHAPQPAIFRLPGEQVVEEVHAEHPEIEERTYQIECLGALSSVRRNGGKQALIHMATGLGKTTVAALDVRDFLTDKPGARVLFVAHQKEILRQAQSRFELIVDGNRTYGTFTGDSKEGLDADCVFASFQQLHRSREEFEPDTFDYIVVDESHHSKATTYEPSLEYFKPKFLLGMTATPERRDLKEIREIFGEEVYAKTLDAALSEGLLARPKYHVILDDITELLSQGPRNSIKAKEYKQLNKRLFIPKRDEEIAEIIAKKLEGIERPKVIAFCPSIEHADRMADLMPNATALHSEKSKQSRTRLMDSFLNNGLTTITTVDLFNEGIDVADANVIVFLRSTESETIFQQQLGRGLRKTPGKESVLVLDFVASCDRLVMIDNTLGAHAEDDNADVVLDDLSGLDNLYDLDFAAIHNRNEIDLERSDFTETTRHILELLRSIDRRAEALPVAPEGWVALRSLIAERSRSREFDRLIRGARKLGIEAVRYATTDQRTAMHIPEEDVAAVLEKYNELVQRAENKIDWNTYSNDELIVLAQRLSPGERLQIEQIKTLNRDNAFPSWSYVAKRFGSITKFQRECGFEVLDRPTWKDWTNDELINYAKELSPDKPLLVSDIKRLSKEGVFISSGPLSKRFGSLRKFQVQCGFEVKDHSKWQDMSDEDLLILAKELSHDKPFTTTTLQALGKEGTLPSWSQISKRFGSIAEFNQRLGHEVVVRTNWDELSDADLKETFLGINPEKHLTTTEINTFSKEGKVPSRGYIESRFGSLRTFYELCGYTDVAPSKTDWSQLDRDGLVELAKTVSPDKPITEKMLGEYSKKGTMPSKAVVKRLIGNLTELQIASGFSPSIGSAVKLDKDDIIAIAKELSPDTALTHDSIVELYREGRMPSNDVIRNRFGSLRAFQQAVWG